MPTKPVLFKSVGCAAWDLAACGVARKAPPYSFVAMAFEFDWRALA